MSSVYDDFVEGSMSVRGGMSVGGFMKRITICLTAFAICAGAGMGKAQTPDKGPQPDAHGNEMAGMQMGKPAPPAGPLKIMFGDKSSEWTAATLAALPHKTITLYNEHAKANQIYSGVELIDLLKPLGVPEKPHGKEFRLYLVAEGSDGYEVVYSVGEVTPDVHDGTTMVADSMDGKPIGATGPLQLVTTGEKRPARWVHNLVAIRVRTAE
jgi:hypothetical protein